LKSLLAVTESFLKLEKAFLDADAAAGSNVSLTLKNNNGLAQNDFIVIGQEGSELAELEQINAAVSGNTYVQVATLKFAHKKGEPVTKYRYNKRKFYGATSKTGTYTELTTDGSPKEIQVDDPQGTLLEYTGTTYTFFKATYFNSQTSDETALADAEAVEADESKRYTSIYNIRKHAGIVDNPYLNDAYVETKRKQAENEINSAIFGRYVLPLSEVPPLVQNICTLLAAGYIDYEEFGRDGEGVKWLGEARALLKAITKGTQRLLASDGTELSRNAKVGNLQGYPDSSITAGSADDRKFKIGDTY
jgi:phage gp36-like protein